MDNLNMSNNNKKMIESVLSHSLVVEAASCDGTGAGPSATTDDTTNTNGGKDAVPRTHLLEVQWSDGSTSLEPVSLLARDPDRLLPVVSYLHQHNLLIPKAIRKHSSSNQEGPASPSDTASSSSWSQQLPEHIQRQLPIVLLPDASHPTYEHDIRHLDVVHRALNLGFPGLAHSTRKRPADSSYRALREGAYEIFVAGAFSRHIV
jgi:hypothetical protein